MFEEVGIKPAYPGSAVRRLSEEVGAGFLTGSLWVPMRTGHLSSPAAPGRVCVLYGARVTSVTRSALKVLEPTFVTGQFEFVRSFVRDAVRQPSVRERLCESSRCGGQRLVSEHAHVQPAPARL